MIKRYDEFPIDCALKSPLNLEFAVQRSCINFVDKVLEVISNSDSADYIIRLKNIYDMTLKKIIRGHFLTTVYCGGQWLEYWSLAA